MFISSYSSFSFRHVLLTSSRPLSLQDILAILYVLHSKKRLINLHNRVSNSTSLNTFPKLYQKVVSLSLITRKVDCQFFSRSFNNNKKLSTLLDLTELNVNHIIPSYGHLSVSCRSLVDRCGFPGSCKPQI